MIDKEYRNRLDGLMEDYLDDKISKDEYVTKQNEMNEERKRQIKLFRIKKELTR